MTSPPHNPQPQHIKKYLGWLLVFLVILGMLRLLEVDPQDVVLFMGQFEPYSVLVFIGLYVLCVYIPFGTTLLSVVAGLYFGVGMGSVLTIACALTLSFGPFFMSRFLIHDWLYKHMNTGKAKKIIDTINQNSGLILFYIRLIPTIPFELQNYAAGLTNISIKNFFLATLFGISPIIVLLALFGETLQDIGSPQFFVSIGILILFMIGPPLVYGARKVYTSHND